jgi:hypothetical protein
MMLSQGSKMDKLLGMRVQVYRNLHKNCYSVRDVKTRRVIAHVQDITLTDVNLKVSQAGRARVIREGKKNVHAVVEGTVIQGFFLGSGWLTYNPYKYDSFVNMQGEKILQAVHVALDDSFKMKYAV